MTMMQTSRAFAYPVRCKVIAFGVILLFSSSARADEQKGRIKHDITVGANHDVTLKTDQVVQVMKSSGSKVVIMAQMPDGSSGVYQIDVGDIELVAATPAPTAPVAAPALTNAAPASPVAATPSTPTNSPAAASAPDKPAAPPTYPNDFVGGPEFDTTAGKQAAGTASIIKLKGGTQSYIVSARHLLGPDGGFEKQTAAKDVPAFVKSIEIESFSGGTHHYNVTGLLVPANQVDTDGEAIDDMAVYQNHDTTPQDRAVALADQLPDVGTPVWVVARVRGGVPEGQIMQSGKVISNSTWIKIQFDNDGIIAAGASGAPVLNAAGEVIGVYSGHSDKDGHVRGFIIPAVLIAQVIKQAAPPTQ
jgi:hypothetical protein